MLATKRRLSGQTLIHHAAQGKDVCRSGNFLVSARLLGRHVRGRAEQQAGGGERLGEVLGVERGGGARPSAVRTDRTLDRQVDLALFDTYGRPDFAEVEISELVADDRVGCVVVFTNSIPPAEINRLLAIGVSGCLSKSLSAERLVDELELIATGEQRISSFEDLANPVVVANAPGARWGLTYRESEVLALLSLGMRNKEIAAELGVSQETVQTHLKRLFVKLGVNDRTAAVTVALTRGIVHLN